MNLKNHPLLINPHSDGKHDKKWLQEVLLVQKKRRFQQSHCSEKNDLDLKDCQKLDNRLLNSYSKKNV